MTLQQLFEEIIKDIKSHHAKEVVEKAGGNREMEYWHNGHVIALTKVAKELAHWFDCAAPEEKLKPHQEQPISLENKKMEDKKKDLQEVWDYTKQQCSESIGDLCNVERGTAKEKDRPAGVCFVCKKFAASALIDEHPGTARCSGEKIFMSKGKCKNLWDDGNTCCTSGKPCIGAFDCPYYVDADAAFEGWLCVCGHWEESDLHCSLCGAEPPWGCDCDLCRPVEVDETEIAIWNSLCADGFEVL